MKFKIFVFVILTILVTNELQAKELIPLNQGWEFRQLNIGEWLSAKVPGEVHIDLMKHNIIKDAYYRTQEKDQQWVDKVAWEYRTYFDSPNTICKHIDLKFNGLDTYATVYLNGEEILSTDNMFRTFIIPVKSLLKAKANELHVVFESPIQRGLEKVEKMGFFYPTSNDQSEEGGMGKLKFRTYTRKAAFHFGWDWGPRLVTSGIWRNVEIVTWDDAKIESFYIATQSIKKKTANVIAEIDLQKNNEQDTVSAELLLNGKSVKKVTATDSKIYISFKIDNPKLWWPRGYGDPYRYEITTIIYGKDGKEIDRKVQKAGIRTTQLVTEPDKFGRSFYFSINGKPIFCKGANYIPSDMFQSRVVDSIYNRVMKEVRFGNMNMLRVWGGGIYEDDKFYDLCDENGIMIWQDFMFACGMYPTSEGQDENIKQEAIDNIKRLRKFASIVLWCGSNEVEMMWSPYEIGGGKRWKENYTPEQQKLIWGDYEKIFYEILPKALKENNPTAVYHFSSPSSGVKGEENSLKAGNMHYWGVWHSLDPFSGFEENVPRFMTEYGMQSFPEFSTVKGFTTNEDWDINSPVMVAHQRGNGGNNRIIHYVNEYYTMPTKFEDILFVSQIMQADAIGTGIEIHRRSRPFCMGSLYWQLNDCWPVASWSSVDYNGNFKALHYRVRKSNQTILISPVQKDNKLSIFIVNDSVKSLNGNISMKLIELNGKILAEKKLVCSSKAESVTNVIEFDPEKEWGIFDKTNTVVLISLSGKGFSSEQIHYWVKPKELKLSSPDIIFSVKRINDNVVEAKITSQNFVKNFALYYVGCAGKMSDNHFDLIPSKSYSISFEAKGTENEIKDKLTYKTYNDIQLQKQ